MVFSQQEIPSDGVDSKSFPKGKIHSENERLWLHLQLRNVKIIFWDNKCYKEFNMSEIKTVVYFDIEATGLKNSGRPRITEVSFVAVNTKDVL